MLREMRKISFSLVLTAIMILLSIKILPHHHHTLHLPETLNCIATIHIGIEECDNNDDAGNHHNHDSECPGREIFYTNSQGEEFEQSKNYINCETSPFCVAEYMTMLRNTEAVNIRPHYKIPKIPDRQRGATALRAPPIV